MVCAWVRASVSPGTVNCRLSVSPSLRLSVFAYCPTVPARSGWLVGWGLPFGPGSAVIAICW